MSAEKVSEGPRVCQETTPHQVSSPAKEHWGAEEDYPK